MYPANISQVVFLYLCVLYMQLEKMANLNPVKLSIVLMLMILLLFPADAKRGGGFGGGRSKSKIKFSSHDSDENSEEEHSNSTALDESSAYSFTKLQGTTTIYVISHTLLGLF